jgi:hypothetical protein
MKRLSLLTLIFAALSFVFLLLLVFLRIPFPLNPLMSWQDALDLLTPLILIPIYWLMFRVSASGRSNLASENAFLALAILWVMGHSMHLSANSISNLIEALKRGGGIDTTGTGIFALTYFYDELLSHYLWHIGIIGLAALLIYREWRQPAGTATVWWQAILGGLLYGFTSFCIFLEGNTVLLGLPFVGIVVLITMIWGRSRLAKQPILAFFFVSCLVTLLFFAGWGLYWGDFRPFSEVGLI